MSFVCVSVDKSDCESFLLSDLFWIGCSHQYALVDEQDRRVGFEVDALGFLNDLETLDGDISFVGQAESDDVQHDCGSGYVLLCEGSR